mmetsp:Transcript_5187/g.16790  ORF Transcript_5187/g.16790 Transcript_5187/m.16790 type:complete len:752 (-) Transcript_5187:9-2264(-)
MAAVAAQASSQRGAALAGPSLGSRSRQASRLRAGGLAAFCWSLAAAAPVGARSQPLGGFGGASGAADVPWDAPGMPMRQAGGGGGMAAAPTASASSKGPSVVPSGPDPAATQDIEEFIEGNKRWLNDLAEDVLRKCSLAEIRGVAEQGSMANCRDPVALVRVRIRAAQEAEREVAAAAAGRVPNPATDEEFDAFMKIEQPFLNDDAEELLRSLSRVDIKRVMNAGTLSGCRNPAAVIRRRIREAREAELEDASRPLAAAAPSPPEAATLSLEQDPYDQEVSAPAFTSAAAAGYLYTSPEEVQRTESKFAQAELPKARRSSETFSGGIEGIGGMVEILGKKYGCAKGERLRCVGERGALWQLEGGKSAPKAHEGIGFRWILEGEAPAAAAAAPREGTAGEGGEAASTLEDGLSSEEYFSLGTDRVEAGDLAGAEEAFRAAARLDGENADAHFSLGQLLANKLDFAGAEDAFRAALGIDPNDADGCFALALILKERGDVDGAEVYYEAAIRSDPEYVDAYFRLGEALAARGDLDGAGEQFRAMLKVDSERPDGHYDLGRVLRLQKDLVGAEESYRQVLRIDPESSGAFYELGRISEARSDDVAAEESYRSAIKHGPRLADGHFRLAGLLAMRGELAGAGEGYRAALRDNAQDEDARYALGLVLRLQEDMAGASEQYRAVLKADPNFADVHFSMGLVQRNQRDLPASEGSFRTVLRLDPRRGRAQTELDVVLADPEYGRGARGGRGGGRGGGRR